MTGRKAFIICGGRTLKQSNEFASDVEKERAKLSLPVIQMAVILFTNIRRKKRGYNHPYRKKRHLGILSLKIWLPILLLTMVIIDFAGMGDPSDFYQKTPDFAKYALNIFALLVSGLVGYRIFERCDINTNSDRGLFGLQLLSAGLGGAGLVLIIYTYFWYFAGLFIEQSLFREVASVFAFFMGVALILVSAYLLFKFQKRSGIIIYHR